MPVGYLARLIWQESSFRAEAVSPKGAQGIAQFMPGTAADRGLVDPFDAEKAIHASAALLADLRARFGNLGLAAAAYNAGAQRVANWLAQDGTLPWETQAYVLAITGIPADAWADRERPPEASADADAQGCVTVTTRRGKRARPSGPAPESSHGPWGVQVAGDFSRARAVSSYGALQKRFPSLLGKHPPMLISARMAGRGTRAFYRVRVPMPTRQQADRFCAALQAAGGSCVVLKT